MVDTERVLSRLWNGTCGIVTRTGSIGENKRTVFCETTVVAGQPCRLSYKTIDTVDRALNANQTTQEAVLFLSRNVTIPAGSKIIVTQNGITVEYGQSGKAAVYSGHQEVPVEIFRGWA